MKRAALIALGLALSACTLRASLPPPRHPLAAIRGGDPQHNAAELRKLLLGEPGAYRDAVLLNAAAALMVAGRVDSLSEGVEEAGEVLDNGLANTLLDCWIAYS